MIKGAIFDMDGTLLDSMYLWINIGPRFLESRGIPYTEEIAKDTKLMLLPEMGKYLNSKGIINKDVDAFIDEVNQMVEAGYYNDVVVKDGVVDCLEELKKRGVKMVVATATDRHLAEAALKRNEILDYFEKVFTCTEVGADKKVPTIFNAALQFLGTEKSDTYVFEDTYTPIKTASDANFPLVAVCDKWSKSKEELIRPLAKQYVENLRDIDFDSL